jgi:hypothetical protein
MYRGIDLLAGLGYNATRFRQMLDQHQGVETARRLVLADGTAGLWKLLQMGKLDMSVEMWVLYPEYEELFDRTVIDRARAKLLGMNLDVEAALCRHQYDGKA